MCCPPRALPESPAFLDASLIVGFGLVAFTAVGVAGYLYSVIIGKSLGAGIMIGGTLLAGMIATAVAIVVAYYVAMLTARLRAGPGQPLRPHHHQRHGPGRRACLPVRSVSIGGWHACLTTTINRATSRTSSSEAKDVSELMVDLAYAAVFFNDGPLADEVDVLEDRMEGYLHRLREISMLAARSPEDAEAMSDVLHIAAAMEKIGNAATDIAHVVKAKLGIPADLRQDLRHADEIVGRVRVREGAPSVGRSLKELLLPSETGMWLIAIRRGSQWEFDPQADSVLSEGDVLLFHGPEDGMNLIRAVAGAPALPEAPDDDSRPWTSWIVRWTCWWR